MAYIQLIIGDHDAARSLSPARAGIVARGQEGSAGAGGKDGGQVPVAVWQSATTWSRTPIYIYIHTHTHPVPKVWSQAGCLVGGRLESSS